MVVMGLLRVVRDHGNSLGVYWRTLLRVMVQLRALRFATAGVVSGVAWVMVVLWIKFLIQCSIKGYSPSFANI